MLGICKLCDQEKELKKSHAIGRTIFNKVLASTDKNVLLNISPRKSKILSTNDQWDTYQLCADCEALFNKQYENYSIQAIRGKYDSVQITETRLGRSFQGLKQEKVIMYVLSIFWRAAQSNHPAYSGVTIPDELNKYLKYIFLENKDVLPNFFNVRMRAIKDEMQLISKEGLQKVLISPYVYKENKNVKYVMLFEGWYFEIFYLKPSFKERKKYGFLRNGKKVFLAPFIDFSEIPGLMRSLVHGKAITDSIVL
ncbi:hypothetical protein QR665_10630 [Acinetobacter gerneri]|uniref:hypothetical protein n=1 Tax=Acinetobacter gerneri TaxID=202952 RepID=UPI0029361171|nr:hypothetical protein [Acinetobacter gerneri]MDV2439923.1 hypothetical protein [Acinetobacter gerneri]